LPISLAESVKVDPKFAYRVWQHNKRRGRILGIPDTGLTRSLQATAIATAALDMKKVMGQMDKAAGLNQTIRENYRKFKELKEKAVGVRKKSLANQYYQQASEMLIAAREAEEELAKLQKEIMLDGTG
jgi:hypothetical protein